MSTMLSPEKFFPLAQFVAENGVCEFAEVDATLAGMEVARRLSLHASVCTTDEIIGQQLSTLHPEADIYIGDTQSFFEKVLPMLAAGPAVLFVTRDTDLNALEQASGDATWIVEVKP